MISPYSGLELMLCTSKSVSRKLYFTRTDIVKDEKGDLVAESHSILARWRNYFSQLLNLHGVNEIGQAETQTAEPLVLEPSVFEVELAIEKLKNYKSPGIGQIPAELIKAVDSAIRSKIYKLIISIWNKERMPEEWKKSIIVPIYKKGDKTDCNNYRSYHFYQQHKRFYLTSCFPD